MVADVYCVVRPKVVASVLSVYRLFLIFPKQYSITTVYMAFTLY